MPRIRRRLRSSVRSRAFTLIELLVVIAIILITTLVAMPIVYNALSGRQVVDAAGIFAGALAGVRDAAIRQNEPRGLRLMPDPLLTIPAPGQPLPGRLQLAFSRLVPIEPAADYTSGKATIGPQLPPGNSTSTFPPAHPITAGATYPFPDSSSPASVLMVEESPFQGGFVSPLHLPNEPTNWWWNVRLGDKIKFGDTGRAYTVVGPCTINPNAPPASGNVGNPELFVNVGPPGTVSPLTRSYYDPTSTGSPFATAQPEFLFLVNGEDDDQDGYVDPGWDGYDNNGSGTADEAAEWIEVEEWKGGLASNSAGLRDQTASTQSPSFSWIQGSYQSGTHDVAYSIERRPVPSPGAREILLPSSVVIDATTWKTTQERSRLPVDPLSLTVDVMINPNGLYIPTTAYSSPTSANPTPFLHFWITDRSDVHPDGAVWGSTGGVPNANPNAPTQIYRLPMTTDAVSGTTSPTASAPFYPPNATAPVLKADRRLVTLFCQSGMVVTNTIDTVPQGSSLFPGEGFNILDVNQPYYKAQLGQREVR